LGPVLRTVLVVASVLLIVGGVAGILATGLDPVYSVIGLAVAAGGIVAVWRLSRGIETTTETAVTSGRSRQKPISQDSEKPKLDRRL
jgi:hypothetical protein